MKIFKILIIFVMLPLTGNAIRYMRGMNKISPEEFDKCESKVYRKVAQDELSPENHRAAVREVLVGKAINDIGPLKKHLERHPDSCTYLSDGEKL